MLHTACSAHYITFQCYMNSINNHSCTHELLYTLHFQSLGGLHGHDYKVDRTRKCGSCDALRLEADDAEPSFSASTEMPSLNSINPSFRSCFIAFLLLIPTLRCDITLYYIKKLFIVAYVRCQGIGTVEQADRVSPGFGPSNLTLHHSTLG